MTDLLYQHSFGKYRDDINQQSFKDRVESLIDKKTLFNNIDNIEGLSGAAITCIDDDFSIVELRKSSFNNSRTVVIRFPSIKTSSSFAFEASLNRRVSNVTTEVIGTALSCGAALFGWIAVSGSLVAIPVTGGASTLMTGIGISASTASSVQCFNGAYRTYNELYNPEMNDFLDSQTWYQATTVVLDAISLVGAGAATVSSIKAFKLIQKSSGRTTKQILKNMTRAERRNLTKDINRLNNPGKSNNVLKRMVTAKKIPKRYSKQELTHAFKVQIKDGIGAALTFSGSALAGFSKNQIKAITVTIFE